MKDETLTQRIEELGKTEIKTSLEKFRNRFNSFIEYYRIYQKSHTKYLNSK